MYTIGDRVKIKQQEGINSIWIGATGTIVAVSDKGKELLVLWDCDAPKPNSEMTVYNHNVEPLPKSFMEHVMRKHKGRII